MQEQHGLSKIPEYRIWQGMKSRCHSPTEQTFSYYGGRGIVVCERWRQSFKAFIEDVGRRPSNEHTIERIDNDGNYEPGNVKWATHAEQVLNRRTTLKLTLHDQTKPLVEWAEITGIPYETLRSRIRDGWTDKKALTTPVGAHRYLIAFNGETYSIPEWADKLGVKYVTLKKRIKKG